MLSKNITLRNSKRLPFYDKTNVKVKKRFKQTVPYKTNSVINNTEVFTKQLRNQRKQIDPKISLKVSVQVGRCEELENRLNNIHKNHNDSKNIKINLRERKIKDYKDFARDSSDSDKQETHKKHVPIYLQKIKSKEPTKITDPFVFTDEHSKKNKKGDNTDSDSSTFDKTMQEILKEITKKEKKAKTRRKKVIKKNLKSVNQPFGKTDDVKNVNDTRVEVNQHTNVNKSNLLPSKQVTNINNVDVSLELQSPSKQINIISNILIQPSQNASSPTHSLCDSYDDLNYFEQHSAVSSTPWRGNDLNLKRNPHWLVMKDTSLPFYNQEMILQPELLEKSVTNITISKENSYVQTDISDYLTGKIDTPVKVNNSSSLFDEHSFSPIKSKEKRKSKTPIKTNDNLFDENNFSPIKNKTFSNTAKRSILGLLNTKQVPDRVQNVHSCYNFSFMDDEDKENVPRQFKNKKKDSTALPMRISITDLKKVQNEAVEELLENIVVNETLNESLPHAETSEINVPIGLFEDLESQPIVERTYKSKKRRRVRVVSVEEENDFEEKPKKKKNLRSKAEEKAFDKWAASFNAMCKEVEQHHLEVEPI